MFGIFDKLPPLKSRKNVYLAFLIGIFFGSIGVSIYFQSFIDFFMSFVVYSMLIFTTSILTQELVFAAIFGAFFAGYWGVMRALHSNKKLDKN